MTTSIAVRYNDEYVVDVVRVTTKSNGRTQGVTHVTSESTSSDWKARLLAAIDRRLDARTKAALANFAQFARMMIRKLIVAGASDVMIRAIARPSIRAAYAQLLYACGVPFSDPTPEFIDDLIDSVVAEVRARRTAA